MSAKRIPHSLCLFRPERIMALDGTFGCRYIIRLMQTIRPETSISASTEQGSRSGVELVDQIAAELHEMIGSLRCAGTGRMVKAGISMTHLHILWVLEHHGDVTMSRLAELLDVSLSNATGLVDRMAERGLIDRVRVPNDRRVVLVRPSEQGARIRDEIEAI